jgi:hypothetical protein
MEERVREMERRAAEQAERERTNGSPPADYGETRSTPTG